MMERLEERLLLTALEAGHYFLYQNSQNETVRVDLTDNTGNSVIHLFAYDDVSFNGLVDLPGLYDGNPTSIQTTPGMPGQVLWTGGNGAPIFDYHMTGAQSYAWAKYNAQPPQNYPLDPRGAETEIFAIYVEEADPSTVITIQTLSMQPTPPPVIWQNSVNGFASTKVPVIAKLQNPPNALVNAPANSGGVIIGAFRDPIFPANPTLHTAVLNTETYASGIAQSLIDPTGTYFYTVHAGLTVSSEITDAYGIWLGPNVQSLASDGTNFYSADVSPFIAQTATIGSPGIGIDIRSLVDDSNGHTLAVENTPLSMDLGVRLGVDVNAIAADQFGNMYFVDQINNSLYMIDPNQNVTLIGPVIDSVNPNLTYVGIQSMDFNPIDGLLYAVGMTGTPLAPKLLTIDVILGKATLRANITNVPGLSSIAFDASGNLYGVNSQNSHLVTINTTTGATTDIGQMRVGNTNLVITGISFVYAPGAATGTLYAASATDIYTVNRVPGPQGGVCTPVQTTGLTGVTGLTFNQAAGLSGVLWATNQTGAVTNLAQIILGGSLIEIDKSTSLLLSRLPLVDGSNGTFVYNVDAMDFISNTWYAAATTIDLDPTDAPVAPAGQMLVMIDPATGLVTPIAPITVGGQPLSLSAMAFSDTTGLLYGVSSTSANLYEVSAFSGVATSKGVLPTSGFTGLQFVLTSTSNALYGVTGSDLYDINIASPGLSLLMGHTGLAGLSSLAFDKNIPGMLWATNDTGTGAVPYELVKIPLAARLVSTDLLTTTEVALLIDSQNPALAYNNIRDWTFDSGGTLWAIGSLYSMDPVNVPTPAVTGPFLINIDLTTGLVTKASPAPLPTMGITSLAFDNSGALFGFDASTDEIVRINKATAMTTVVTQLDISGVTGIAFDVNTNTLFAITDTTLYTVDLATGHATQVATPGQTGISSLATDPSDPANLYFTAPINGVYTIFSLSSDVATVNRSLGKLRVAGTIAGWVENPIGNINVVEAGFLFGKITIAQNNDAIVLREGGGVINASGVATYSWHEQIPGDSTTREADSWINIGGTTGGIYSDAGTMATLIKVQANPNIIARSNILEGLNQLGLLGTATNTTKLLAQPLVGTQPDFYLFGNAGPTDNWFALPLLAGQTVTIDAGRGGHYIDLSSLGTFWDYYRIELQDSSGRILDTIGDQSLEDYGVYSIGTHQRPIVFKAMEADVYYVHVLGASPYNPLAWVGDYTLQITNGPAAALSVRTGGDLSGQLVYDLLDYQRVPSEIPRQDVPSISVQNGASIGAIIVGADGGQQVSYIPPGQQQPVTVTFGVIVRTFGGGNIFAFEAGRIRSLTIASEGWIGEIEATTDFANVYADAGFGAGSMLGAYNNDAFIQNISAATDVYGIYNATGSIGFIEAGGNMGGNPFYYCDFSVNTDGNGMSGGPAGTIDLIKVANDWGSMAQVPTLTHGPGGDIGYISVGGTVYVIYGQWISALIPTIVTDGSTSTLYDDGGGQLVIDPSPLIDPVTGAEIVDPVTGLPVFPTYSYGYIGVDDASSPGVGAGGAIFSVAIDGPVAFRATGHVDLGMLDLTGLAPASTVSVGGSGSMDVYFLTCNQDLAMTTTGSIVSADITGDVSMTVAGSVGAQIGRLGEWLPGHDAAPTVASTAVEPQFGWFHGTLNGLNITGDVTRLNVGGFLQDLRVVGGITRVVVDSDNVTTPGGWDGVNGIVWSQNRLEYIKVGDGLEDDGPTQIARAGIFCTRSIGTVEIVGPRYVVNGVVFGELNGAIIGGQDETLTIPDPQNPLNTITVTYDAVGHVIGTNGATLVGSVIAGDLDDFQVTLGTYPVTGTIGEINFSGPGSGINGAGIHALMIRNVITSADSNGIAFTYFSAQHAVADVPGIGEVVAGGPGMHDSKFSVNGGSIGVIKGAGPVADMWSNSLVSTDGLTSMTGRRVFNNDLHMPGKIGTFSSTDEMSDNTVIAGSIGTMASGGNFARNQMTIAGQVTTITVGGSFVHSSLILQGPAIAFLKSLVVNGDISGVITSGSRIGQIISRTGQIWADISTLPSGQAPDVDLIQAAKGFTGNLNVSGNLNRFIIGSSLGSNPATNGGFTQRFQVGGNLNNLRIAAGNGTPGDLFADFSVAGNVGTMDIDGTLFGIVSVNGSVNKLTLDGGLGGFLDMNQDGTPETPRGKLSVMGTINTIKLPSSRDIVADMSVGGSIKGITLKGGSILGNLQSRFGKFGAISVTNGSISGNLTANSFDKVAVTGGNITGNITATNGAIKSLSVKNGTIDGDIVADNGTIDSLSLAGASALAGNTIRASQGFGKVTINGTLAANLTSGRGLKSFTLNGGDLSGNFTTIGDIATMKVGGRLINGTIRTQGKIGSLTLGGMVNATVSSAESIDKMTVAGNVDTSKIVAGLDVGPDNVVGGTDDVLGDGSVRSLKIGGLLKDSIISAGVSGGTDGILTTINDDGLAPGISIVGKVTVGGLSGVNTVLAETAIDAVFAAAITASGGVAHAFTPAPAIVPPFGQDVFGPGAGEGAVPFVFPGDLVLSLSGAGVAKYDGAGHLTFEGTNSKSTLVLQYTGTGAYFQPINITGGDDASIGTIRVISNVPLGNVSIDGTVGTISANVVNLGSTWNLPAGATNVTINNPQNMIMTAGDIGKLTMNSAFNGGSMTAESVGTMTIVGDSSSPLSIETGGNMSITGNFSSTLTSMGTINALTVGGAMSGTVKIFSGDLTKMTLGSLSGVVNNGRQTGTDSGGNTVTFGGGKIGTATIGGDFGGNATSSLRTSGGITKMTVGGNFSGIMSTPGGIGTFNTGGIMSGRAFSGAGITRANFGSMSGGLLTSSGDIVTTKISGAMANSLILAGFNPGDAGFDSNNGGEIGNVQIDALTPAGNRNAANADSLSSGNIKLVQIGGDMTASSIAAGVGPGTDGFLGTGDDHVFGIGTVGRVVAGGNILGTGVSSQSFGVFAASNIPAVFHHFTQPFTGSGNVHVSSMISAAGPLTVIDVMISNNKITAYLNHAADSSTIKASAVKLLASIDSTFGAGDQDVTNHVTVTYDSANRAIVLTLKNPTPNWAALGAGNFFQVTIDDAVSDSRGNFLDGDFVNVFPSGDGTPGGDFVFDFQVGNVTIAGVPSYIWWFGCAPTSAGMLVGYYDTKAGMDNLIDGSAATQTAAVNEAIASSGNGVYTSDANGVGTITPGTPGTGHIPDYALYGGIDDSSYYSPYPDMSQLDPTHAHADNCIADFMETSESIDGSTLGGTPFFSGFGDGASHEASGVEGYFRYKGHTAVATDQVWAEMTWSEYVNEIDAGRPVLLGVDSDGNGASDHMVTAVGYNQETRQYGYYNTWDNTVHWSNWAPVAKNQPFGIDAAVFVRATA